ncbi:[FeFe] hydrogenase H-cluster radical SAM maturase HydE [Thermodesulfovibrionales bacterium]|nr:[FeFe] hydrogenase H-cluster radical SAM maturase HydE [Thermodesulfovibrionales bacterium]
MKTRRATVNREPNNRESDNLISLEELLKTEGDELILWADEVRSSCCGGEVHLRGLIEFSNYCIRDCLYCGLRRSNKKLTRYRMPKEEIVECAVTGFRAGLKTIVLQSGDDPGYRREDISRIIHLIKARADVAITLCVGERDYRDYSAWKKAGSDRYLLRHETANSDLYSRLHPGQTLASRLKILGWLKEIGYQVGAGNIVGLPGQTLRDLADDILLMKSLDIDMAGIGPFVPHPDTPLGGEKQGELNMSLKVLAAARIVLRDVHLPATTATGSIHPEGQKMALRAGANVVMPNITPAKYRPLYQIYPDKTSIKEDMEESFVRIRRMIELCGRRIAGSR